MPNFLIPMIYAAATLVAGVVFSRIEHTFLPSYLNDISVGAALAFLGAVASGTMSLTAIVFSVAYITVQFNAIAYSPRLALWFANDPRLFHSMGVFISTFVYALCTMAWVDRSGGGGVPLISGFIVAGLLLLSTFRFTLLIRGLSDLQVTNTLLFLGDQARATLAEMYPRTDDRLDGGRENPVDAADHARIGPATQTLVYRGPPRSIATCNVDALLRMASRTGAVVELERAVGDTIVFGTKLMSVHGGTAPIPESDLLKCIRLKRGRTFEQDLKYSIRLLVDISIKALSAALNDPTTAVQGIDQLEDILRRLGRHELDTGYRRDADGVLRVIVPMPSWEDYLRLSFDEIRNCGVNQIQVMRRLRSALMGIAEVVASESRTEQVNAYLRKLDLGISRSSLSPEDQEAASQADPQGIGISRRKGVARHEGVPGDVSANASISPLPGLGLDAARQGAT